MPHDPDYDLDPADRLTPCLLDDDIRLRPMARRTLGCLRMAFVLQRLIGELVDDLVSQRVQLTPADDESAACCYAMADVCEMLALILCDVRRFESEKAKPTEKGEDAGQGGRGKKGGG